MDWNDGYVTDIAYTSGAHRAMSPHHLAVACVLNGVEPRLPDRPFTYLELGCGQGLTANLLAAANPQGRFYAVDFMPAHIAGAQGLADEAALDNLTLLDASFADLSTGSFDVPKLDFVALHGVYSWISPANRRYIVDLIGRHLRPGGVVYVSYNALPGWAEAAPLQRLLLEYANSQAGDTPSRMGQASAFVKRLVDCGARYFADTPGLQRRLESLEKHDPRYLAHEYLNRCWHPMFHWDVARELAAAKLDYAGPAMLGPALWRTSLPAEQVAAIDACPDPALRETVKDYVLGTSFRCDLFVRGVRPLAAARRHSMLSDTGIALVVPPMQVSSLPGDRGETRNRVSAEVIDLLARGPCELARVAALPVFGGGCDLLPQVVALMSAAHEAAVYWPLKAPVDGAPARRLNWAIARRARIGDECQSLASPLLGNSVSVDLVTRLAYLAYCEAGAAQHTDSIVRDVCRMVQAHPCSSHAGAPAQDAAATASRAREVLAHSMPMWQQLGLL